MANIFSGRGSAIRQVGAAAYTLPTDYPEADGTLAWDSTTILVVQVDAGGQRGCGYSYTHASMAGLVRDVLAPLLTGRDPMQVPRLWQDMLARIRNLGRPGLVSCAVAAVDVALWDLKARLLGIPLVSLLGASRDSVPVYGSGGFTSYPPQRLCAQLAEWVGAGIPRVKMKVGSHPDQDLERVRAARDAIGPDAELYVDANGAYSRKQALAMAQCFAAEAGVSWLEEPVSSDDPEGLRLLRDRLPAGMELAAGEYGYRLAYFRDMLAAGAVDVIQADATRCAGITELLRVAAVAEAHQIPLSSHTAPALHLHAMCAIPGARHMEYFHDHVRIEQQLFDGVQVPVEGRLQPDLSRPGHGLTLRESVAARFAA